MNYIDMNNLLLQSKLACNDTDSLIQQEIRDRAISNSTACSQDYMPSNSYYQQNNLNELNLLLTLLTQNSQSAPSQQVNQQSLIMDKSRSNSDASILSEDMKSLFDLNNFSLFSQNQFDLKTNGQVFIPKPIRTNNNQKTNTILYDMNTCYTSQGNSSPSNQQSQVQNILLESLNIFSNLMRKESINELPQQNVNSVPSSVNTCTGSSQQSQIMYQPNIIFGVQLSSEEMQRRREIRRAKMEKYVTKKMTRKWDVLRYEVRKKIAKTRLRVKGRFVKEEKKIDSDDSQVSNPLTTQLALSNEQVNSIDNI